MIAIVNHAVVPVSSWIIIEGSNWTVLDQNKKKKINNTTILIRIRMTKSSCSIKINSANQFPFFSFLFSYSAIIPAPWTTYLQRENRIYKWHTETEPDEFSWNLTKGFWIFFGHIKCDVQSAYQSIITPRARTDAYTHTHTNMYADASCQDGQAGRIRQSKNKKCTPNVSMWNRRDGAYDNNINNN